MFKEQSSFHTFININIIHNLKLLIKTLLFVKIYKHFNPLTLQGFFTCIYFTILFTIQMSLLQLCHCLK